MKNAEKFLKNGVDVGEFVDEYADYYTDESVKRPVVIRENLRKFLEEQVKPTLSEDEKVILRNIDYGFTTIRRDYGELYVYNKITGHEYDMPFYDLFQFIKDRRRI